jgi:hypothetical protein
VFGSRFLTGDLGPSASGDLGPSASALSISGIFFEPAMQHKSALHFISSVILFILNFQNIVAIYAALIALYWVALLCPNLAAVFLLLF